LFVLGVPKIDLVVRVGGARGGRAGKLADALAGHLPAIGALAARKHGRVRGTSAGEGTRVDAHPLVPRPTVVGIIHVQSARFRGSHRGRARKRGEAVAARLSHVRALAAREMGGVAGRVAVDGEAAESGAPSGRVDGMPLRLGGGGAGCPPAAELSMVFIGAFDDLGGVGVGGGAFFTVRDPLHSVAEFVGAGRPE